MGTVNGSGPIKIDTALSQLQSLDKDAEVRVVKAKNGEFQIKTGQTKGRFKLFKVFTGFAKKATLRQQQDLVSQLKLLNPQAKTSLHDRTVVTAGEARSFILELKQQTVSGDSPTPSPRTASDPINQLLQQVKDGAPSLQDTLNKIDDLDLINNLEKELIPNKEEICKEGVQQTKNYSAVRFRKAQLTGVQFAKEAISAGDQDARKNVEDKIKAHTFSDKPSGNKKLQTSALNAAKLYLDNAPLPIPHPAPADSSVKEVILTPIQNSPERSPEAGSSPSDVIADYYLRGFEDKDKVKDIDDFHARFEEGLRGLGNDDDSIERVAGQITEDGDPLKDISGATHLVKQVLAKSDVSPEAFQSNRQHYNQLRKQTSRLSFEASPVPKAQSRYANIISPAATNVPVALEASDGNTYEYQGQIHANYVTVDGKNQAIATQYPINNTKNEQANNQAMGMFWRMAAQQETDIIIDLTQARDGHKPYYPTELNKTAHYDGMDVTLRDQGNNYYTYEVTDTTTGETTELLRYNFPDWTDKTPLPADQMYQLVDTMSSDAFQNIVMHCSAGVGRTGTAYVGTSLLTLIRQGSVNDDNIDQVLDQLIMRIRPERGQNTVQTEAQRKSLVEMYHYIKANGLE